MGFYRQVIFPWICDFLLGRPYVAKYRKELLSKIDGEVLEIGFGTGLNLPHYPESLHRITAVDPNPGMQRRAARQIAEAGVEVDLRAASGEQLPFMDGSFDTVVSTFTLCSIDDVNRAVAEVYRVLRSDGRFLFLEHGLSPDPAVRKWQRRLNRLEMWLADGCRLDRNMRELVATQPFRSSTIDEFDMEKTPRTHGHLYQGLAIR